MLKLYDKFRLPIHHLRNPSPLPSTRSLDIPSLQKILYSRPFSAISSTPRSICDSPPFSRGRYFLFALDTTHPFLIQVRHITAAKLKKRKWAKERRPKTPEISKVKKIKMKFYSSYKSRFRTMSDGKIRRWRAGKRHNAHSKSKIAKRRLRQPAVVPDAYAKVMKKLGFCA